MVQSKELRDIYNRITDLSDFTPTPEVNQAFSSLVSFALQQADDADPTHTLSSQQLKNLQNICMKAECVLEAHWSNIIVASQMPQETLCQFPYYQNYVELTRFEWEALQQCTNHTNHDNVVFCGGGSLPLTAILLAQWFGISTTVIDHDHDAVSQATSVVRSLQLNDLITVRQYDAETYPDFANHDVIYVPAAISGTNATQRIRILHAIKTNSQPSAHILTRSTWGMRTLLYPPLQTNTLKEFNIQTEIRPPAPIVNSILVLTPTSI